MQAGSCPFLPVHVITDRWICQSSGKYIALLPLNTFNLIITLIY